MKKIKSFFQQNYMIFIVIICFLLFLILAKTVMSTEVIREDIQFYNFIRLHFMNDTMTKIVKVITQFGGTYVLLFLSVIFLLGLKDKKLSFSVCVNLVFISFFNLILKSIFQRPRPTQLPLIIENGYSFPSGHSMISMAFYGYLIYLTYQKVKNPYMKWGIITFLSLLILIIGLSRIYLGVHYLTDVLAGFFISFVYLYCYIRFTKRCGVI